MVWLVTMDEGLENPEGPADVPAGRGTRYRDAGLPLAWDVLCESGRD